MPKPGPSFCCLSYRFVPHLKKKKGEAAGKGKAAEKEKGKEKGKGKEKKAFPGFHPAALVSGKVIINLSALETPFRLPGSLVSGKVKIENPFPPNPPGPTGPGGINRVRLRSACRTFARRWLAKPRPHLRSASLTNSKILSTSSPL